MTSNDRPGEEVGRAQIGGDPAWHFLAVALVVVVAVVTILGASFVGPNSPTEPPATNPPADETNETTAFTIVSGPEPAAADWAFPTEIRFDRVQNESWVTAWSATVDHGETVEPHLTPGERYRLVLEDATGRERVMGSITYDEGMGETLVEVFPCCIDDFSGGNDV